jgi:type IV secretion system protein VirD4
MKLALSQTSHKLWVAISPVLERMAWMVAILLPVLAARRWPIAAVVIGFLILFRLGQAVRANSSNCGSARWSEYHDLKNANLIGPTGLILVRCLGIRAGLLWAVFRLYTAPISQSRAVCEYFRLSIFGQHCPGAPLIRLPKSVHGLVCAPPGAGKGVAFVLTNLLTYPGSVVAIDPKGELFSISGRVRRKRLKNRVIRLDPLQASGPGGARLNPLMHIDSSSPLFGDQTKAIAEALVVRTGREQDDPWNDASELGITGALLYVITYAAPEDRNLNAVADLLTDGDAFVGMVAMMCDVSGDLESVCCHTHAYKLLKRYGNTMASWEDRELGSIRSSIGRHMSWLHSPLVESHLSRSDFDPQDLVNDDITVYLILPPKYLSTLSRLLRLWFTTLYGSITECGQQEGREVLFMLDEAGNLGPMPSLYQAITLGRSYGLRVWLILQSISQLKNLFPKDGEHQTVEASLDHRMFFGVRDLDTAKMVSEYAGTATIGVTSYSKNSGGSRTGSMLGAMLGSAEKITHSTNWGTGETNSEIGRKLLMPDELIQLPADMAVILTKGVPPVRAWLAKYYEAPELAGLMPDVGKAK